jgi:PleD family two-component response regulator
MALRRAMGCYRIRIECRVRGHHSSERGTELPHKRANAFSALPQRPGTPTEDRSWCNVLPTKHQGKILSISTVAADHRILRRILNDQVWQIDIASSYREAVAHFCRDRVDVVICASHLPDGTWKDLLGHIAEMPDPPALVVTSTAVDAHLRSEVRALGGYDVMTKPLNAGEVRRVLSAADPHRSAGYEMPLHA